MSGKKKIGLGIILLWLLFWPFLLSYKAIKWGWVRNKVITAIVTSIVLLIGIVGAATGDSPVQQVDNKISTEAKATSTPEQNKTPEPTQASTQEPQKSTQQPVSGQLKVHFLDVGQADSILIQTPGGKTMLIDAGNNGDASTVTNYIKSQGINKLDIVVGTHPHEDHIGGLDAVINGFSIGSIYMPKVSSTTKTFEDVLNSVKNKDLKVTTAAAGVTLDLGEGIKAEMIAPNGSNYEDLNDWSAVIKLTYGNTSFLLTGDAESISEKEILSKGYNLKADVLKVAHHGSGSSTTAMFLDKVNPKYAVIQVGKDNDYGHPHKSTMQRLQERGIQVYRNDQNDAIVAISDGSNIAFNTQPGNYDYAGEGTSTSNQSAVQATPEKTIAPAQATPEKTIAPAQAIPEKTTAPVQNLQQRTVYYTPSGKSYHYKKDCSTLSRSKTINEGLLNDVIATGHADPCDKCVPQ